MKRLECDSSTVMCCVWVARVHVIISALLGPAVGLKVCSAFRRGPLKLGMAKITHVDFPPKETVSYTKETQTPVTTQQKEGEKSNPST